MLKAFGMAGSLIFIVISLSDGITRIKYDSSYHPISLLSLGERDWLGILNFIVFGLFIFGFAWSTKRLKNMRAAFYLFLILGIGLLTTGIFVTDPMMDYPDNVNFDVTLRGVIHQISALIVFLSLSAISFYLGGKYKKIPNESLWSYYSYFSAVSGIVSFLIYVFLNVSDVTEIMPGMPAGLFERISMYIGCIYIFLFSYRLTFGNNNKDII